MDLNLILSWIVGASCTLGILRIVLQRRVAETRGWFAVFGGILALFLVLIVIRPQHAGLISAIPWGVLIMLPSFGSRLLNRWIVRGHHRPAQVLSRVLCILHPADGWLEQPKIVRALTCLHYGEFEEARALLANLRAQDTPLGRAAILLDAQTREDWPGFLAWIEGHAHSQQLLQDSNVFCGYLWALAELGDRERMVAAYHAWSQPRREVLHLSLARLHVAALVGDVTSVRHLLDGPLSAFPDAIRHFWIAIAEQTAGRTSEAEEHFEAARRDAGANLLRRIERRRERLTEPTSEESANAPGTADLSSEATEVLRDLRQQVAHESHYAVIGSSPQSGMRVTWALALVLLVVFAFEMRGGSTDLDNLVDLGALVVPTSLTEGEWWRRFTAGFLHFGPLHLVLNVLSLLILGRWLERAWGKRNFLLGYLVATFTSTGLLPLLNRAAPTSPEVFVGASGGIMGLLGGLLAHLVIGHRRGPSRMITRQLLFLLVLVVFQAVFDLSTPNVSSTCHLLGLVAGFLFGLVVAPRIS